VDVPFINLIPKEIQNNEWFDTVQKIITTRDFDNFSAYDDNVNWRDPGSSDGFCSQGYGTLLAHYRKDVPVKLNTAAKEIKWDGKGVKVYTSQGTISAKACIITVSTGVLNAGKIKFTPTLPVKKYEAFDGISMSSYYRVTLQLKEKFYKNFNIGPETYFYTKVNSNKSKSPRSANGVLRDLKNNISFFNIKGQFARELEAQGIKASVDFVLSDLRSTFGSNFDQYLIKSHVTDWLSNPFTLGAYSGAKPGKARLRKVLKESVGDRIFFAGEATAGAHGTVHGADRSGKRVVEELLRS
jgi:monoamine oxidase